MLVMALLVGLSVIGLGCPVCEPEDSWSWEKNGDMLEIAYGNEVTGWPQMAVIHLDTGALRMVYGPDSGWEPTVYIPPSLWTEENGGETHYLGAPVSATVETVDGDLLVELDGAIGGLDFASHFLFSPPANDRFEASANVWTSGEVTLADRPSEAFKPVHVASMFISETEWDSQAIRIDEHNYTIPLSGWVVPEPGASGDAFTLVGGSSEWKPNAPSITVLLDRPMDLQGWVTESTDPNDDNVGFWCATGTVLDAWEYEVIATP